MATITHRKLSRKELKQPDEFLTFFDTVGNFVQDNFTRVVIVAVVVVALLAAIFSVDIYSEHQSRATAEDFYQAAYALEHKDYKAAEQGFRSLADSHSAGLGQLAGFYLGNTYLAQGKAAQARSAFQDYLKHSSSTQFRQLALTQLGVANENLGDYAQARDAYTRAAALAGPEKERAELGVARMLMLEKNQTAAIAAYQRFLHDNPFSVQRAAAVEALAQLGVSVERLPTSRSIELPPAPESH